jgi:hypothetical protein
VAVAASAGLSASRFVEFCASSAAYAGRDLLQNLSEGESLRGQLHCQNEDVYAATGVCV